MKVLVDAGYCARLPRAAEDCTLAALTKPLIASLEREEIPGAVS